MITYINQTFNNSLSQIGITAVYIKYLQYLPLLALFTSLSILITPWIGKLAYTLKILDLPAHMRKNVKMFNKFDKPERHIHKEPRALLGGLMTTLNILLLFTFITGLNKSTIPILTGVLIITLFSFFDDKINLPPRYQLLGQLFALTAVAISSINWTIVNNPITHNTISLNWFSIQWINSIYPIFITFPGDILFIIMGLIIINALKWVGGSDGLIESNSVLMFLVIFIIGIRHQQELTVLTSIAIIGTLLGFLIYALPSAYIESGSIGKTLYGYLLTVLAILNGSKLATIIMVLALPLADFILVVIYRYRAHKPKNVLELMRINEATHFHHVLLKLGFSQVQLLLIEISITLFASIMAIITFGAMKLLALFITFLVTFLIIILMSRRSGIRQIKKSAKESPEKRYSY